MGMLAKLFKALNSDSSPWQLAWGFAFGMLMGLTPLLGLHTLLILFTVLFFRVNLSAFLIAWSAFAVLAIPLSGLLSTFGEYMLLNENMYPLWQTFYSTYLGQLTQFYHTLTFGGLVLGIILFPAILFISKKLVEQYRQRFMQWVNQWRIVQFIKGTNFYQLYQQLGA